MGTIAGAKKNEPDVGHKYMVNMYIWQGTHLW